MATRTQLKKAEKYLKLGKIHKVKWKNAWMVYPLAGCNRVNLVQKFSDGTYLCTCQFNRTRHKPCSHIIAVKMLTESKQRR